MAAAGIIAHRAPPSRHNRIRRGICSLALRNRAQSPSRSLPLFSRAGRSSLRVALSTNASLLPLGAFALVPLLHDDRPRTCVPMTTAPNGILSQTGSSRWAVYVSLFGLRLWRLPLTRNTGDAPEVASGRSASPHGIRRSSALTRGAPAVLAHLEHAASRLDLRPDAPSGHEGAGEHGRLRNRSRARR